MRNWLRELAPNLTDDLSLQTALLSIAEELSESAAWAWNFDTGEIIWSANMFRILGLDPAVDTPSPEATLARVHPADRERMQAAMQRAARGDVEREVRYRIITKARTVKLLRAVVAVRLTPDGQNILVGWLVDQTSRQAADREIAAHIAVSSVLASWNEREHPVEDLLEGLATALGFSRAVLWVPHERRLKRQASWADEAASSLVRKRVDRGLVKGEGLAGLAWQKVEVLTLSSAEGDSEYRFRAAAAEDVQGAAAIPVSWAGEILAIISLAGTEEMELTERLRSTLTGIGAELGSFLAHRTAVLSGSVLSAREREIVRLAAHGLAGPEIAEELHLSPATVKSHLSNIYSKYGVTDRVSAVMKAMREGLID